jgi:hypothetical protein
MYTTSKSTKSDQIHQSILATVLVPTTSLEKPFRITENEFQCVSVVTKIQYQFVKLWKKSRKASSSARESPTKLSNDTRGDGKSLLTAVRRRRDRKRGVRDTTPASNKIQKSQPGSQPCSKNNIMKECMEVFYDKRFRQKLTRTLIAVQQRRVLT